MSSDYPTVTTLNFEEFAIVDVTIALEEPLDGNSGQSSFRLHVDGGTI